MKLKLGKWNMIAEMAKPNTLWWHQVRKNVEKPVQRVDSLLCIERIFIRSWRVYIYSIKILRLRILIADTSQSIAEGVLE